jgi:CheY-like chemotaxis protein
VLRVAWRGVAWRAQGVEVLNQLRSTLRNEVSIIMLASDMMGAGAEMVERCIVEGADSYILKPAALKELTALWGFVARRRQHHVESASKMADLNEVTASSPPLSSPPLSSPPLSSPLLASAPRLSSPPRLCSPLLLSSPPLISSHPLSSHRR